MNRVPTGVTPQFPYHTRTQELRARPKSSSICGTHDHTNLSVVDDAASTTTVIRPVFYIHVSNALVILLIKVAVMYDELCAESE